MSSSVVIAGGSLAGLSVARELRKQQFTGEITTIDLDVAEPYRRPAVSKTLLNGAQTASQATIPWPEELGIRRVSGTTLTHLDTDSRTVVGLTLMDAEFETTYDKLVIATGAGARPLPVEHHPSDVVTLRSSADALGAAPRLAAADTVIIIGAGFIGLEVASVARAMGKRVTVLETATTPLAHAVGSDLGGHISELHTTRDVQILCGVQVHSVARVGSVVSVATSEGSLDADLVFAAVGSVPEVAWLGASGLDVSAGVLCDAHCRAVGVDDVWAAGDVANWHNPLFDRRMRVEHWTNALEQGTYVAQNMMGRATTGFSSAPYFWSEQFGLRIQSVGSSYGHDEVAVLEKDGETLTIAYGKNGTLVGVAGVNSGPLVARYRPKVEQRVPLVSLFV